MTNLILDSELFGPVGIIPYPVQVGASETLEYRTDIITSISGITEDRSQMRAIPRQSLEYSYELSYENMQGVFNAVYSNIRGNWLIPLWFELQPFTASVGQTNIAVDTTIHDIRANSYVLIYKNVAIWEVVKVTAIEGDNIDCEALTIAGPAHIIPLRYGKYSQQSSMSPTGHSNKIKANFIVSDVLQGLTETVTQLNGLDFYTTPYLTDGAGDTRVIWDEDQVEFDTGNIDQSTQWTRGRYSKGYLFDGGGQAELRALKNYFYRRAGRYRSFMSPTFETNLRNASVGSVGTAFKFLDDGYTDNIFPSRSLLGFQLLDGSWLVRTASDPIHLGGGEDQVTLDTALDVDANEIVCVSFISENRLDTDRLEITLNAADRFKASASVLEISP